jgi:hypothetical protein
MILPLVLPEFARVSNPFFASNEIEPELPPAKS